MLSEDKVRRIEIKTADGWVSAQMDRLEDGDVIRLFDSAGEDAAVKDDDGNTEFVVQGNPMINVEPYKAENAKP